MTCHTPPSVFLLLNEYMREWQVLLKKNGGMFIGWCLMGALSAVDCNSAVYCAPLNAPYGFEAQSDQSRKTQLLC
jgi:hypothetical protein